MRLKTLILLAVMLISAVVCIAPVRAEQVGKFDFKKRTSFSLGVDREWAQADSTILGQNDVGTWRGGLHGAFRIGDTTAFTGGIDRAIGLGSRVDWRYHLGLRWTVWNGSAAPKVTP